MVNKRIFAYFVIGNNKRNIFLGHIVCYMTATHIGNVNVGKSKEAFQQ